MIGTDAKQWREWFEAWVPAEWRSSFPTAESALLGLEGISESLEGKVFEYAKGHSLSVPNREERVKNVGESLVRQVSGSEEFTRALHLLQTELRQMAKELLQMVPEEVSRDLRGTLPPSLGASIVLFWRLLWLEEPETSAGFLPRLAAIEEAAFRGRPDEKLSTESLAAYAHVVGATTIALAAAGQRYSERMAELLERIPLFPPRDTFGVTEFGQEETLGRAADCSWRAVWFLLHLTDWDYARKRGEYERALHSLSNGLYWATEAHEADPSPLEAESSPVELDFIRELVTARVDVQEAANTFLALKETASPVTWVEIPEACACINDSSRFGDIEENRVLDADGFPISWPNFWGKAEQYARSRVDEANAINVLRGREEKDAASRLETYFFPDGLWMKLPERARAALIMADRVFRRPEGCRPELVVNELRVACEQVLDLVLWRPFQEWTKKQGRITSLQALRVAAGSAGPFLLLSKVIELVQLPEFEQFLTSAHVSEEDRRFLRGLISPFRRLRDDRAVAEHPDEKNAIDWPGELDWAMRTFLGVGQTGILPRLLMVKFV